MAENKNFEIEPTTKILVTCGNSHLGKNVIKYLLEKKYPPENIYSTVRTEQKGEQWKQKGVQIRIADYSDPESLIKAFAGIDRIYMVSSAGGDAKCPRDKQHLNVVEAAKKCGVKLVVYSGFLNCQKNANLVANDHKYTEKILEESGLNYSIARNASYMDCNGELFKYLNKKENNLFYNACKDSKIGFALIRELGEAGACILLKKEPKKIYELAAKPISYIDIKDAMEKMTGKKIKILDASFDDIDEKYKELGFGLYFGFFVKFMCVDYLNGIYNIDSTDMEDLMGHPLISLEDRIKEVIDAPNYFPK